MIFFFLWISCKNDLAFRSTHWHATCTRHSVAASFTTPNGQHEFPPQEPLSSSSIALDSSRCSGNGCLLHRKYQSSSVRISQHLPTNLLKHSSHSCARSAHFCLKDEDWLTPHELRRLQQQKQVFGCTCANTAVGRCQTSTMGLCAADEAACPVDTMRFVEDDSHYFKTKTCLCTTGPHDNEPTVYGSCGNLCVMDSSQCSSDDTWQPNPSCTCAQVRTGICQKTMGYTCAVDATSCDEGAIYVDPAQALALGAECFLCDAADLQQEQRMTTDTQADSSNKSNKGLRRVAIVMALLSALLTFMVVFLAISNWRFRQAMKEKATKQDSGVV